MFLRCADAASPCRCAALLHWAHKKAPLVARGGPIREANQDSEAARRVRIDLSRFESIEPPGLHVAFDNPLLETGVG